MSQEKLTNSYGWIVTLIGLYCVCNNANSSYNCLSGFKPRSYREWSLNDYMSGCVRNHKLKCSAINKDEDSFWMNSIMRLPASPDTNITISEASECRSTCFNDRSCTAYTYDVPVQFGEVIYSICNNSAKVKQEGVSLSNAASLKTALATFTIEDEWQEEQIEVRVLKGHINLSGTKLKEKRKY
uniref:Apple domain-containing protein n=1 Tax=Solanum lycopersicum TaxID=4081 RepID=A0A3Q7I1N1_SOLLC